MGRQQTPLPDDPVLIDRIVRRDPDALAELFDRYGRTVFGTLHQLLPGPAIAAEVCQEVFLQLWRAAGSLGEQRTSVHLWLLRIAGNSATDWLRAQRMAVATERPEVRADA